MTWLLRLLFLRILGRWAVPLLALVGFISAVRGARRRDVTEVDPRTDRAPLVANGGPRRR